MVHLKVMSGAAETVVLETDAASIEDAVTLVRKTYNRDTGDGHLLVDIDGNRARYYLWFGSFYEWYGSGWCQVRNLHWFFSGGKEFKPAK